MSGGRVELGLGAGWFEAEHGAYGIPFPDVRERFDRFAEQVEIIDGLWRTPAGETYSLRREALPARPTRRRCPSRSSHRVRRSSSAAAGKRRGARSRRASPTSTTWRSRVDAETAASSSACARRPSDRPHLVYSAAQVLCVGRDDAELARRAAAIGHEVDELSRAAAWPARRPRWSTGSVATPTLGTTRLYLQTLDLADLDHLELVATQVAPQL